MPEDLGWQIDISMIYICGHPKFRFLGCMKYVCLMGANCLSNCITTYLSKLRKRCNIIHLTRLSQVSEPKDTTDWPRCKPFSSNHVGAISSGVIKPGQPRNARTKWRCFFGKTNPHCFLRHLCLIPRRCQQKCCNLGFPGTFGFLHPSCAASKMGYMVIPSEATDLCL